MKPELINAIKTTEQTQNLSAILMGLGTALDGDDNALAALTFRSKRGGTLLHECVRQNTHPAVFGMIVNRFRDNAQFDAWFSQPNKMGQTPSQLAKIIKATEKLRLLEQLAPNFNPEADEIEHEDVIDALEDALGIFHTMTEEDIKASGGNNIRAGMRRGQKIKYQGVGHELAEKKDDKQFKPVGLLPFDTLSDIQQIVTEAANQASGNEIRAKDEVEKLFVDIKNKQFHVRFELQLDNKTAKVGYRFETLSINHSKPVDNDNDDVAIFEVTAQQQYHFIKQWFARWLAKHEKPLEAQSSTRLADNLFIQFTQAFSEFMQHPTYFCEHCHDKLTYDGIELKQEFKLLPCDAELCQFLTDELVLNKRNLLEFASAQPLVLDLLICFTYSAAKSHRAATMCDPFPDNFTSGKKGSMENPLIKDFQGVVSVLAKLPKIAVWGQCDTENDLKHYLNKAADDPRAYQLILWIVSSNRALLKKVAVADIVKNKGFGHQFQLLLAAPRKEAHFQHNKASINKIKPSLTTYHGSHFANWHRILRTGVKNCSGTHLQTAGAVHGNGVYMTDDTSIETSINTYCGADSTWPHSAIAQGRNLKALALMELLDHPGLNKISHYNYYVENDDAKVRIADIAVQQTRFR